MVCFTRDDQALVVGDKTGEASLYSVSDLSGSGGGGGHLLGHFSMLLDVVSSLIFL